MAREVAEALAERCRAGVIVNVLLDGFGTLAMPAEYLDHAEAPGCHMAHFRPLGRWLRRHNNRNHRRILVVDGRVGITGGSGVSAKWTGNGRRRATGATPTCGSRGRRSSPAGARSSRTGWRPPAGAGRRRLLPRAASAARARSTRRWRAARRPAAATPCTRSCCWPCPRRAARVHHQPVLPSRRPDARDAAGRWWARGAGRGAGPRRHRSQHRAPGEPGAVRRDATGGHRDLRVHARPAPRQDHGDRRAVGHGRQHELRQPIVRRSTTS